MKSPEGVGEANGLQAAQRLIADTKHSRNRERVDHALPCAPSAAGRSAPTHFIQSALGHGSVAVTEKYYAKYAPDAAAKQVLRVIEGGRSRISGGTSPGTTGG